MLSTKIHAFSQNNSRTTAAICVLLHDKKYKSIEYFELHTPHHPSSLYVKRKRKKMYQIVTFYNEPISFPILKFLTNETVERAEIIRQERKKKKHKRKKMSTTNM